MRLALSYLDQLTAGRLTFRERMSGGPRWLRSSLCATESARTRLREWFEHHPQPWAMQNSGEVLIALHFVGDIPLHQLLAKTLALLPPPVTDHVLKSTTFAGVGSRIMGFTGARPALGDRPFFVALSAADTLTRTIELMLHEVSHVWLMPAPEPDQVAGEAFYAETLYGTPLKEVPPNAVDNVVAARKTMREHERTAKNLTRDWCAQISAQNGDKK